jgi:hypothetical protein
MDDLAGLAEVLDALDTLADDVRPPGSFHRGEYHRLRIGRYRVLYDITEETVLVRHIARVAARLALRFWANARGLCAWTGAGADHAAFVRPPIRPQRAVP